MNIRWPFFVVLVVVVVLFFVFVPKRSSNSLLGPGSTAVQQISVISPSGGDSYLLGGFLDVKWSSENFPGTYYMSVDLVDGQIDGLGHLWTFYPIPQTGDPVPLPLAVVQAKGLAVTLKPGGYKLQLSVYDGHYCLYDCPPGKIQPNLIARGTSAVFQLLPYISPAPQK